MKSFIFIFFLVLPFLLFAQEKSSVDILGGVEYSFRYSNNPTNTFSSSAGSIFGMDNEDFFKGGLGWRAGFNYNKRLSQDLLFKSGLRVYHARFQSEKLTGLMWGSEHDGVGGWAGPDPNLFHEFQIVHKFWFLEIPIALRYEFVGKKLIPYFEGGFAPSVYLNSTTEEITDIGRESYEYSSNIPRIHLVLLIAGGVNYSIHKNLGLFIQPSFRYHLTGIERIDDSKDYLYGFGIEVGVRRFLN